METTSVKSLLGERMSVHAALSKFFYQNTPRRIFRNYLNVYTHDLGNTSAQHLVTSLHSIGEGSLVGRVEEGLEIGSLQ